MSNTQDMSQLSTAQLLVHGTDMGGAAELLRSVGAAGEQALARQYHLDRQGGVQATSAAGAALEADYGVDAWGNVLSGSALDNPLISLGGLGYWQEPDLGLSYVRARWLDPHTGSWMSVDPVTSEPRYSYVKNNPTMRVDPSGAQSGLNLPYGGEAAAGMWRELMGYKQMGDDTQQFVVKKYNDLIRPVLHRLDLMINFLNAPEATVRHMEQTDENGWFHMVDEVADQFQRFYTATHNHILPASGVLSSLAPAWSQMTDGAWYGIRDILPKPIQPYFPPSPNTSHFIRWMGGFVYGVCSILKQYLTLEGIINQVRLMVKGALELIKYLLTHDPREWFEDVFKLAHNFRNNFVNFFEDVNRKDYFHRARDLGAATTNIIVQTILLAGPAAAKVIQWLSKTGKIAKAFEAVKRFGAKASEFLEENKGIQAMSDKPGHIPDPHGVKPPTIEEIQARTHAENSKANATKEAKKMPRNLAIARKVIKIGSWRELDGAFIRDLGFKISQDPIAYKAYQILQKAGVDIILDFDIPPISESGVAESGLANPFNRTIKIYVRAQHSIHEAASTLIHEAVHVEVTEMIGNHIGTQWEEFHAYGREEQYLRGRALTQVEEDRIWQFVTQHYSHLPKGNRIHFL